MLILRKFLKRCRCETQQSGASLRGKAPCRRHCPRSTRGVRHCCINCAHKLCLTKIIIISTHCTRSLKLLRAKAFTLFKTNDHKASRIPKAVQKAQLGVRKSAISSAIKTITKLTSRKKLPPIVKHQRAARRQDAKQSKNVKKPSESDSQSLAKSKLGSTKLGPKGRRQQKGHKARSRRRALFGSSFGKNAICRKKNLMSRYQF